LRFDKKEKMLSAAPSEHISSEQPASGKAVRSVLSVHNYYQQAGGEDRVFEGEIALLERHGHRVLRHEDHNDRLGKGSLGAVRDAVWSPSTYKHLKALTSSTIIDVAHFHNTFPLISPAAYYAVQRAGIPVIQTLHNFRLICAGATLSRNGSVCESCLDRQSLLPGIRHGCYRNSRPATAALSTMLAVHRAAGTYQKQVDVYVASSEFGRNKFIQGGLPEDRIVVKPNFVSPDPGIGEGRGDYALFVGRLAEEKGVRTLAAGWTGLDDIPLQVAGDGPLRDTVWPKGATWVGAQARARVMSLMQDARVLVFPSTWYECAPMTIVEAFACGLPVIASNLGSIPEFVKHRHNGLLFEPGDPQDLARQVRWAFEHPEELREMRANARREFEEKYTSERNYKMLMTIYEMAIEHSQRRRREAS
jgi:glycosyltransferase involved in cell wall biosynthesis